MKNSPPRVLYTPRASKCTHLCTVGVAVPEAPMGTMIPLRGVLISSSPPPSCSRLPLLLLLPCCCRTGCVQGVCKVWAGCGQGVGRVWAACGLCVGSMCEVCGRGVIPHASRPPCFCSEGSGAATGTTLSPKPAPHTHTSDGLVGSGLLQMAF